MMEHGPECGSIRGKLHLYVMPGIYTSVDFLDDIRDALRESLTAAGFDVLAGTLFPYGDWSRSVVRQLRELRHDMMLRQSRIHLSIGGSRVLEAIQGARCEGTILFVGHSGGAVAAVHAAFRLLGRTDAAACRIAAIGSPRFRVPEPLRQSMLYLFGARPQSPAKPCDPICRIGTWGGWTSRGHRLRWESGRYAPAYIQHVPLIGGHADYFRTSPPYVDGKKISNLEHSLQAVLSWFTHTYS